MVKQTKEEKKKINPIVGVLFAIVIPIILAVTLAIIIFAAGVDVVDWAKEKGSTIPVISSFITTPQEENIQRGEEQVQAEMERKDTEIEELNQNVIDLESTIEQMEQEIVKLENNNGDSNQANELEVTEGERDTVKTVSNSFKDMDKEQAALIMADLEEETAISILQEVSSEVRGEILEEMETEAAASLTQLLIDSDN